MKPHKRNTFLGQKIESFEFSFDESAWESMATDLSKTNKPSGVFARKNSLRLGLLCLFIVGFYSLNWQDKNTLNNSKTVAVPVSVSNNAPKIGDFGHSFNNAVTTLSSVENKDFVVQKLEYSPKNSLKIEKIEKIEKKKPVLDTNDNPSEVLSNKAFVENKTTNELLQEPILKATETGVSSQSLILDDRLNNNEVSARLYQDTLTVSLPNLLTHTPIVSLSDVFWKNTSPTIGYFKNRLINRQQVTIGGGTGFLWTQFHGSMGVFGAYSYRISPMLGLGGSVHYTKTRDGGYANNIEGQVDIYLAENKRFEWILTTGYGFRHWRVLKETTPSNGIYFSDNAKGLTLGTELHYKLRDTRFIGLRVDTKVNYSQNTGVFLQYGVRF